MIFFFFWLRLSASEVWLSAPRCGGLCLGGWLGGTPKGAADEALIRTGYAVILRTVLLGPFASDAGELLV